MVMARLLDHLQPWSLNDFRLSFPTILKKKKSFSLLLFEVFRYYLTPIFVVSSLNSRDVCL